MTVLNKPKEFTPQQIKAIEIMAQGDLTYKDVCEKVGVTNTTLRVWRQDRTFIEAVVTRSRELLKESLPSLYLAAIKEAKAGNHSYFRTIIEHVDRLEDMLADTKDKTIVFKWADTND